MACRIGITTNPAERKRYWQSVYPSMTNWHIITKRTTKTSAQTQETQLAKKHGCQAHQGGYGPERAIWYVYGFNY